MRRRQRGLVTKRADCPNCGETFRWREQRGIRRFRAKIKRCQNCDEVWR